MMQLIDTNLATTPLTLVQQHRLDLLSVYSEERCCLAPDKYRQILNDYLDYLDVALSGEQDAINISQVQEMLLEVACIIRSGKANIVAGEYRQVLQRLVRIYGIGFAQGEKKALTITAADYADVIEAISEKYPTYDYNEALSQLLYYMGQLFKTRKGSWITVYEHILSMPDSIEAIRSLKQRYFGEIQQWVGAGVQNLFSIRRDLFRRAEQLASQIEEIERRIQEKGKELADVPAREGQGNLFHLAAKRKEKEILVLTGKKELLGKEKEGKEILVELIESNIEEFEDKLKETRRAYFVRLVYVAPDSPAE